MGNFWEYLFINLWIKNKWVRSGLGMAILFYPQEKLSEMECIGDTQTDWGFMIDADFFDASYLIDKRKKGE